MELVCRPVAKRARYLTYQLSHGADPTRLLAAIGDADAHTVVGIGAPLLEALEVRGAGVDAFPSRWPLFPSTQAALWLAFLHADDSKAFDAMSALSERIAPDVEIDDDVGCFEYKRGRDLSGFKDGTENPTGKKAERAALRAAGPFARASVALVQRWVHDLGAVERMPEHARDDAIGRRRKDDRELPSAPPSAHVKRTAQDSFTPEAFVLRRSMPWSDPRGSGLYFIAYAAEQQTHERLLARMAGVEDGIVDALFSFTRPVTSSFFLCPGRVGGKLDLRAFSTKPRARRDA